MIKAVIFDLDNTLVDFMAMKDASIKAAVHAMIDAGLDMDEQKAYDKIYTIYRQTFIENQTVFDLFLEQELGKLITACWLPALSAIAGHERPAWCYIHMCAPP